MNHPPDPAPSDTLANPGFEILLEQGPCLVVCKPGGLLTQAPPYIDSLERRVKQFLKVRDHKPGRVYLGVTHRLDRPVSGAVALARHVRAARRICDQFAARTVGKRYWAVVEGNVAPERGVWRDFVRKVPDTALAEVCEESVEGAREAVLEYEVRGRFSGGSWLEIRLETGRMHQIRVQAAARGAPVWGDFQYGATTTFGPSVDDPRARWIALHARWLEFKHPMTREPVRVAAPLPSCWGELPIDARDAQPATAVEPSSALAAELASRAE